MPHIIVGTAGHIDHGKTALVKALTGTDTDRLKEEKARGITIDLGFASLSDGESTIGFVDVPGHERFVKNMLAGVGGIDVVMLVVASDESVMPQTREHLAICSLLRIRQGVTVLTKMDAVDRDTADVAEMEVQELVKGTFLEGSPVLRVSARTGEGVPALVATLKELATTLVPRDASRMFRLPVDRAFTMKGFGAVAAGTLLAGRIRRDDEVELLPGRTRARVRGIQVHGQTTEEARAGQRTALNLQRVDLSDISRGMVITAPGVFAPSATFDVRVELLPGAPTLPTRKRIRFHTGTSELIGHLVLLGQDTLEPSQTAFARVRLERPTFALPGDRFIIRQYSPMSTLGGGEILDAQPPRLRRSDPALMERLRVLSSGDTARRLERFIFENGEHGAEQEALVARTGLLPEEIRAELLQLQAQGRVRRLAESPLHVAVSAVFDGAVQRAVSTVHAFHTADPLVKGIAREDLRARSFADASPALFRAVLDHLVATKRLEVEQDLVYQFGRRITLEGADSRNRELIVSRFRELGLQAPAPDDVVAELHLDRAVGRKIIQLLVKDAALVKVNESLVLDAGALRKLVEDVRARKVSNPKLGVGEFKELTGLSRKFAVPLLEYLDAQRVTRRMGDERVIL